MKNFLLVLLCIVSVKQSLAQCESLAVTVAVTSNYNGSQLSCFGANDGQITATATGGQTPYTFELMGNGTTNATGIFNALSAGAYSIKVTDANNCERISSTINIIQPSLLVSVGAVISNYNGQQTSCAGSHDGIIAVTATGGAGAFTYTLNEVLANISGVTTGIFTGLSSGSYTFSVTDINGCQSTSSPVTLLSPQPITAVVSSTNGEPGNCTDGGLSVNASGGTGAYTFSLLENPINTTGVFSGEFTSLTAGTYTVLIRDENYCSSLTASTAVVQGSDIVASASITSNYNGYSIQCFGNSNGEITVSATGGTGNFTYTINEFPQNATGQTSGVFSNLVAGSYSFTVTDAVACETLTSPVVLTSPSILSSQATVTSNYNGYGIPCFGNSNGEITVNASGGVGDFTYTINQSPENSTGQTSGVYSNLAAGSYSFTVADAAACETVTSPIVLTSPAVLTSQATVSSNYNGAHISCFNAADGEISFNATGGTQPYQFKLNDFTNTTGVFTGLIEDTYEALVTDVNNCVSFSGNVNLVAPAMLYVMGEVVPDQTGSSGGVNLTVTGGTAPYEFLWSNGSMLQNLSAVRGDTYSVNVTDANGCFAPGSFEIPIIVSVEADLKNSVVLFYNTQEHVYYLSCTTPGGANVFIDLIDGNGRRVFNTSLQNQNTLVKLSKEILPAGMYVARIKINQEIHVKKFLVF
jgi:hypothetical protein